jgi:glycosyltransferase involved in cell wall biosynthesis
MPRLRDAGYRIAGSAFTGVEGGMQAWSPPGGGEPIPLFPKGADLWGSDIISKHAEFWFGGDPKAGLCISLMDIWVLQPAGLRPINWAPWFPVDSAPLMPEMEIVLRQSQPIQPIAFSQFGINVLRDAGHEAAYVPHGVDTKLFHPMDQMEARRQLSVPEDGLLIAWVAANKGRPSRKGFDPGLQAIGEFIRRRGPGADRVMLYLHTEKHGIYDGINLPRLVEACGIPEDQVHYPEQYRYTWLGYPPEYLNLWYNAADLLFLPSLGEGFGIPLVEAQSAGCPVLVNNFSAMPELRGAGWLCNGQRTWVPRPSPGQGSWQSWPLVTSIVAALERAAHELRNPRRRQQLREDARTFALGYDADLVTERYWLPVLDRLFTKIEQRPARSYHEALARLTQTVPNGVLPASAFEESRPSSALDPVIMAKSMPATWGAQEKPEPEPEPVGPRPLRRREPVAAETTGVAE